MKYNINLQDNTYNFYFFKNIFYLLKMVIVYIILIISFDKLKVLNLKILIFLNYQKIIVI